MQSEPHATYAEYDAARGRLTIRPSTQVPYYVHLMLARTMDMPKADIGSSSRISAADSDAARRPCISS